MPDPAAFTFQGRVPPKSGSSCPASWCVFTVGERLYTLDHITSDIISLPCSRRSVQVPATYKTSLFCFHCTWDKFTFPGHFMLGLSDPLSLPGKEEGAFQQPDSWCWWPVFLQEHVSRKWALDLVWKVAWKVHKTIFLEMPECTVTGSY